MGWFFVNPLGLDSQIPIPKVLAASRTGVGVEIKSESSTSILWRRCSKQPTGIPRDGHHTLAVADRVQRTKSD